MSRPAAGGGRWIDVAPERIEGWLRGFADRHGLASADAAGETVRFRGDDGALAECHPPFPPLRAGPETDPQHLAALVAEHAGRDRVVGVLLVRLGGHAAGVFEGPRLVASKVGARPVHGRNKAGGQSQKRFQRRREEQAREATSAAADIADRVLTPHADRLDAVVLGGDRRAVDRLRGDKRLSPLFAIATERFLSVPDPKRAVLERSPREFRAVRIRLVECR